MQKIINALIRVRWPLGAALFGLVCTSVAASPIGARDQPLWVSERDILSLDPRFILPKMSTLGYGMEYRYTHSPRFGMRFESYEYEEGRDDVNEFLRTQVRLKMRWNSMLFDWSPRGGGFRATAGLYINRTELSGTANYENVYFGGTTVTAEKINGWAQQAALKLREVGYADYAREVEQFAATNEESLMIDGQEVRLSDVARVSAQVHFRTYAPYLGVGWANDEGKRKGFYYSMDLGVVDLGRPRVRYTLTGMLPDTVRNYQAGEVDAWIAQEEREAEAKLRKYRYFPVLSLGFGCRF